MNFSNPFRSVYRILALIVLGPATVIAVAGTMAATDYTTFTPEPGYVRHYVVPGWDR
jgi:hypothetical protein